jgi:uncharacterized protein DUF5335
MAPEREPVDSCLDPAQPRRLEDRGVRVSPSTLLPEVTMPQLVSVPKAEWGPFFDRMSKGLLGKLAEIEVASLDLGDQIEAEWLPMIGITYDSADDLLDVALDRVDHLIHHPREIVVEEAPEGLVSVAVVDADGTRQIVRLKQPLMLSAGS